MGENGGDYCHRWNLKMSGWWSLPAQCNSLVQPLKKLEETRWMLENVDHQDLADQGS